MHKMALVCAVALFAVDGVALGAPASSDGVCTNICTHAGRKDVCLQRCRAAHARGKLRQKKPSSRQKQSRAKKPSSRKKPSAKASARRGKRRAEQIDELRKGKADDANESDRKGYEARGGDPKEFVKPHKDGNVFEMRLKKDAVFCRSFGGNAKSLSGWIQRCSALCGMWRAAGGGDAGRQTVEKQMALPNSPTFRNDASSVAVLTIKAGTQVRVSTVRPQAQWQGAGSGGAGQWQILGNPSQYASVQKTMPLSDFCAVRGGAVR